MPTWFSNEFCEVDVDNDLRIVRYTRNAVAFPTLEELARSFADTCAALDRLGRAGFACLVDLRAARGSNAPGFEDAMARTRRPLLSGFRRVAVLVQTATGALQLRRHAREDKLVLEVFLDEAAAWAHVRRRD